MNLEIRFQTPNGGAIIGSDLGASFLETAGLAEYIDKEVLIAVAPERSQAGNLFYAWDLNGIPLPDGLATRIMVNGVKLPLGRVSQSKSGNEMRTDRGEILVGARRYSVSALIVRTRRPYWVKVHAQRVPGKRKVS